VSPSTVSRVLSNPNGRVDQDAAESAQAVDVLGYIPNSTAKKPADVPAPASCSSPSPTSRTRFSRSSWQGIEDAAQREDYAVLVGDTQHDERREQRYALMLNSKEADGLIFLGHRLPEAAATLARAAAPRCAPIVNGCEFNPRLGIPSVHIDNARAASDAMNLLYDLGHRRIGVITGPLVSPLSRDRLRGASTTARKRGAEELAVVDGDFSVESGAEAAQRLFAAPSPPTAIFCFNDEMAMGVLDFARHTGIRVPRDLSVVGFDDIRFTRYTEPALTTIAQPMRELGEGTVRLLWRSSMTTQSRPSR
jgi:LacI family repressor for deo operon, udp, cdd, tsx, nupC, and nupG